MRRKVFLLLLLPGLLILFPLQERLDEEKIRKEIHQEMHISKIMMGSQIGKAVLFGFNGIAADIIWLKANDAWAEKEWYRLASLLQVTVRLQPHYIDFWDIGGWHFAYNVSAYHHQRGEWEEERKWIEAGIRFLEEGIRCNPDHYKLHFGLGWTYFHKLKAYGLAARHLENAIKCKKRPGFVDRVLAHAYERKGDFKKALEVWKRIWEEGVKHESLLEEKTKSFIEELEDVVRAIELEERGELKDSLELWRKIQNEGVNIIAVGEIIESKIEELKDRLMEGA